MKTHLIRRATERTGLFITLLLAALTLVACASAPLPPTESLNMASEAIANAEEAEARRYAGAELEEANRHLAMYRIKELNQKPVDRLSNWSSLKPGGQFPA